MAEAGLPLAGRVPPQYQDIVILAQARVPNWLASGFRLIAALLCLEVPRSVILAQGFTCMGRFARHQEFDHPVDLNADQIPDFALRVVESGSQLSCGPWESWSRSVGVRSGRHTEFLVREDTGALLALSPADTISAQAPTGASWRSVDFRLMQNFVVTAAPVVTNQVSGFLVEQTNVLFGLRFRDAEGLHFGWANLALTNVDSGPIPGSTFAVAVVDLGFHPVPGEGLKVGTKPPKPQANPGTKTTFTALALSRQFDARLRRFEWTNSISRAGGRDVYLELEDAVSVLAKTPDSAGGTPVPVGLQTFRRLWTSPAPGQSWVRSPSMLLLRTSAIIDETGSAFAFKSGLLSQGARILGLLTTNDLGQPQVFSLHLDAEGEPSAVATEAGPSFVVGRNPALGAEYGGLDLNDDGRIDFLQRFRQEYSATDQSRRSRSYSVIEPLGTNRIFVIIRNATRLQKWIPEPLAYGLGRNVAMPDPAGPAPVFSGDSSGWISGGACTGIIWDDWGRWQFAGSVTEEIDRGSLSATNGLFIPVQFRAADGQHLGWLRYFDGQVIDYDYHPEPGQPLAMGERKSMKGPWLKLETRSDGAWLIGEAVGPLWRPARRAAVAGALPWSEPFVPNWSWFAEGRWRFEQRLDTLAGNAFFRLGIPGLPD